MGYLFFTRSWWGGTSSVPSWTLLWPKTGADNLVLPEFEGSSFTRYDFHASGLIKEVKSADGQLRDLRRTVEYVENNRESFTHIDDVSEGKKCYDWSMLDGNFEVLELRQRKQCLKAPI